MKYNIKWEANGRVKKNPKISKEDIVEKTAPQERDSMTVTVRMKNTSKEYPLMNIFFNGVTSLHENTDKACTEYPKLIVCVDTDPIYGSVEFSGAVKNRKEVMEVVDKVLSVI